MEILITLLVLIVFQWYSYQALKTITRLKWVRVGYFIIIVLVYATFFYQIERRDASTDLKNLFLALGFFLALSVFQLTAFLFLILEDISRLFRALIRLLIKNKFGENRFLPKRRKFISQMGLTVAAAPFSAMLYGMYKGKYDFQVLHHNLSYDDLPEAFDDFTLTHFSDFHAGSFDQIEKVKFGLDLLQNQGSDIILFTGDLVNSTSDEVIPYTEALKGLHAPFGKFSIMGNHDYHGYRTGDSQEVKMEKLNSFFQTHRDIGFRLLCNEALFLNRDGQRLALVGVENWGNGFVQTGDLAAALQKVAHDDFKILLSHDPSHWEARILPHTFPVHLTLSGHTHGFQFGIETNGFRWSPSQYIYKQWAGVYANGQQRIHVNRGFGHLGYPGRAGIWPEITTITLKKAKKT